MLKPKKRSMMLVQSLETLAGQADRLPGDDGENSNRRLLKTLIKATHYAVEHELTERERLCFQMYFYENKRNKDISQELGLHPTTVSHTIQRAIQRVNQHARYSTVPFLGRPL